LTTHRIFESVVKILIQSKLYHVLQDPSPVYLFVMTFVRTLCIGMFDIKPYMLLYGAAIFFDNASFYNRTYVIIFVDLFVELEILSMMHC